MRGGGGGGGGRDAPPPLAALGALFDALDVTARHPAPIAPARAPSPHCLLPSSVAHPARRRAIVDALKAGKTVVVDRYAHSGVCFSSGA